MTWLLLLALVWGRGRKNIESYLLIVHEEIAGYSVYWLPIQFKRNIYDLTVLWVRNHSRNNIRILKFSGYGGCWSGRGQLASCTA
jgi:hypothetical protein